MMSWALGLCALRVNEFTVGIMMSLLPLVTSTGWVIFFKSAWGSPPDLAQAAIAGSCAPAASAVVGVSVSSVRRASRWTNLRPADWLLSVGSKNSLSNLSLGGIF